MSNVQGSSSVPALMSPFFLAIDDVKFKLSLCCKRDISRERFPKVIFMVNVRSTISFMSSLMIVNWHGFSVVKWWKHFYSLTRCTLDIHLPTSRGWHLSLEEGGEGKEIGGSNVSGQRANKQCGDVLKWLPTPNSASGRRKGGRERSPLVVEEMHSSSLATLLPLDIPLFRLSLCTVSNDDVVDTFNAQWCTEVSADCFPAFET